MTKKLEGTGEDNKNLMRRFFRDSFRKPSFFAFIVRDLDLSGPDILLGPLDLC